MPLQRPENSPATAALVVAGGSGIRFGDDLPKQFHKLAGVAVLERALRAFCDHPEVIVVQPIIGSAHLALYEALDLDHPKLRPAVEGGETRQASVYNGLKALIDEMPEQVLIHDGARPLVSEETISRVLGALTTSKAAIAASRVTDTLKRSDAAGKISATVDRDNLWRAQTPQGFRFGDILSAHQQAPRQDFTDDAALFESLGIPVELCEGSDQNIKITTLEDLSLAEAIIGSRMQNSPRTGFGYDVHRFEPGTSITLCGVEIASNVSLQGHSDADAPLHALVDALFGAIGCGDIGQHFPPTDPRWKGAASSLFVDKAVEDITAAGGTISNVDVTIICEQPKIGPHRDAMKARVAELLKVDVSRVNIKATTTERLGFTGRDEGLAAQAVATVLMPDAGGT